jgi:hypothetical protein
MIRLVIAATSTLLFFSCGQRETQINHEQSIDTTAVLDDRLKDSTKVLVAELPIQFDSTDVLLHAISVVNLQTCGGTLGRISKDAYGSSDFSSGYYTNNDLTGDFINIVFQDKEGLERALTDKKMSIKRVTFLQDIYKLTKRSYLLYVVSDRDTNGDKAFDHLDLESLYISNLDGTTFTKLTKELHELYDWSLIARERKLYFTTLEDKNKDGRLTNKDTFHYYVIDFTNTPYTLAEYNPLKVLQK